MYVIYILGINGFLSVDSKIMRILRNLKIVVSFI